MMSSDVFALSFEESLSVTEDARVAALRWDVLPWALVLDLDAFVGENRTDLRRVWIGFTGLSEVTWPFESARVPNGVWLSAGIGVIELSDRWREYVFSALLPKHGQTGSLVGAPTREIAVRAQGLVGVSSRGSATPGEFRSLTLEQRLALGSDAEFARVAFESVQKGVRVL